ncbi:apolipoprotein L2-like isoform X1 [Aotus nancymaae]|uniref:apolipoprotein L2-like isoform X1 n=1 Tax=Aotus nancymaae TaxID=37293 RepID=UPI0030FEC1C6
MQQNLPGERAAEELPGNSVHARFLEWVKSETSRFIEDACKYFQDKVNPSYLLLLLTDDKAWEVFVAAAQLPGHQEHELREALYKITKYMLVKDEKWDHKDQQYGEFFLKFFPPLKKELEDHIRKLRALADGVQGVHRGTTIANVLSSFVGAISDLTFLAGLGLAIITDGAGFLLLEAGMGLGLAASGTGTISSALEYAKKLRAESEAQDLIKKSNTDVLKVMKEFMSENTPNLLSMVDNAYQLIEGIGKDIRAIRQARANFQSAPSAPPPQVIGRTSAEIEELVERVAERPALALSRGTMIAGAASGGILLVLDVFQLVYEAKHLREGAESELAEELNKQAQELEEKLNTLTKWYEFLQAGQEQ